MCGDSGLPWFRQWGLGTSAIDQAKAARLQATCIVSSMASAHDSVFL